MGFQLPLLSTLVWLPILGGLLCFLLGDRRAGSAKVLAFGVTIITFLLSLRMYAGLDEGSAAMQFTELLPWLPGFNINYHLGVDGISVALVILTTFTTVLVLLGSWNSIDSRALASRLDCATAASVTLGKR